MIFYDNAANFSLSWRWGENSGGLRPPEPPASPCPEGKVARRRRDGLGFTGAIIKLRLAAARQRGNTPVSGLKARRNVRSQGYTRAAGKCVASCNGSFLLFGSPQDFRRFVAGDFTIVLMATGGGIFYIDCRSGHVSIRSITRGREKGF